MCAHVCGVGTIDIQFNSNFFPNFPRRLLS